MRAMLQRLVLSSSSSRRVPTTCPLFSPVARRTRPIVYHRGASLRQYSSTAEEKQETPSPQEASERLHEKPPPTEETVEDPVKKELEASKREIIDLKDRYLRSVADYRNLQDRTKRDINAARDFAISKFARDLLDSVDNLDRALTTVPESALKAAVDSAAAEESNKDLVNLFDGLKMTEKMLMQALAKHGLERYDPAGKGDKFDPNLHDASFMAPMKDKEDGTVFTTIQKGFLLNGRVVRAAKVGVVKNS